VLAAQGTSARLLKAAEAADAFSVDDTLSPAPLPEPVGEPD
jgi:hypothetical protein